MESRVAVAIEWVRAHAFEILIVLVLSWVLTAVRSCSSAEPDLFIGETAAGQADLFVETPPPTAFPPLATPVPLTPAPAAPVHAPPPPLEPVRPRAPFPAQAVFPLPVDPEAYPDEAIDWPEPERPQPPRPRRPLSRWHAGDLTALASAVEAADQLDADLVVLVGQPEARVQYEIQESERRGTVVLELDQNCGFPVNVHRFRRGAEGTLAPVRAETVASVAPTQLRTICRGGRCRTVRSR